MAGVKSVCEPHADKIKAMYDAGSSFVEIAKALGLEYEPVYRWATRRGMRPHMHPTTADLQSKHKQIVKMRKDGAPSSVIAQAIGYKEHQVRRYCAAHGLARFGLPRVNLGRVSKQNFEAYQLKELQRLSIEWGTPTICEAITEIVRDYLEAEIAKRTPPQTHP